MRIYLTLFHQERPGCMTGGGVWGCREVPCSVPWSEIQSAGTIFFVNFLHGAIRKKINQLLNNLVAVSFLYIGIWRRDVGAAK